MSAQEIMLACLYIPLLAIPLLVFFGRQPNIREAVSITAGIVLFACTFSLLDDLTSGQQVTVNLWSPLPGLSLAFKLETLGLLFALLASFLWIVTTIYAIGYMRGHHEKNQTRFYSYFAVAIAATMAIAFSANLFTLFVFYEVLTLSTYPLVAHGGSEKARQGARVYLGILLTTSIGFLLFALIWTWQLAGTLEFRQGGILPADMSDSTRSILFALFVFGVGKAAIMPIHRWLPSAMVAPTPVSALLHAVAVVKAGVFTILKVVIFIFGIDTVRQMVVSEWFIMLASATILLASLVAMRKDNLKARLAYSTVSQLSYILLGAFIATQISIIGSTMHMIMHAFGKITLFFCAGAIMVVLHKTEVSELDGIGKRMPWTMAAFLIGSLSIIGLPPFAGTWSKWYLVMSTIESQYWYALVVLMLSSLLNIAYLLAVPVRAFFRSEAGVVAINGEQTITEAPWPILLALAVTSSGCLLLFFYPQPLFDMAQTILSAGH
jgi:multicomponent Na+:H+ antiporter subunit D